MKYIRKGTPPAELRRWFEDQPIENGQRLNCGYRQMPGEVKSTVKQRLLEEQGGLCCYTGRRVNEQSSHIEHFKPQSLCREHEDIDYNNLLAAFPGDKERRCAYGAHAKDDWYDETLLISPLHSSCEGYFRFNQYGQIRANNEKDQRAKETIKRLRLDDHSLTELRRQAIDSALYPKQHPMSQAQLQSVVERYCMRDKNGYFPHFCYIIVQAAQELLKKAEQKRKRDQAIRSQKAKK